MQQCQGHAAEANPSTDGKLAAKMSQMLLFLVMRMRQLALLEDVALAAAVGITSALFFDLNRSRIVFRFW